MTSAKKNIWMEPYLIVGIIQGISWGPQNATQVREIPATIVITAGHHITSRCQTRWSSTLHPEKKLLYLKKSTNVKFKRKSILKYGSKIQFMSFFSSSIMDGALHVFY